jgi:hypothetical protein
MDFKNQSIVSGVFIGRFAESTNKWILQTTTDTCLNVVCQFTPVLLLITYTFLCNEFNGMHFISGILDSDAVEWGSKIYKTCFMDGASVFTENEPFNLFLKKNKHTRILSKDKQLWNSWPFVKDMCLLYGTTVMDSEFVNEHVSGLVKNKINHKLKWEVKPEILEMLKLGTKEQIDEAFWINEIKYATVRFSKSVVSLNELRRITYDELLKYKLPVDSKEFKVETIDNKKFFSLVYEKEDVNLSAQVPVDFLVLERTRFNPPGPIKGIAELENEFKDRHYMLDKGCMKNRLVENLTKNKDLVVVVCENSTMPGFVDGLPNLLFRNNTSGELFAYCKEMKGIRSYKTGEVTMGLQLHDITPNHTCINVCKPCELVNINNINISMLVLMSNKGTPRRWIDYCKTKVKKPKNFIIVGEFGAYY